MDETRGRGGVHTNIGIISQFRHRYLWGECLMGGCGKGIQSGAWVLLSEDPEAVLSALERGETDGILPAASGFMDRFAKFTLGMGIPAVFEEFPEHRQPFRYTSGYGVGGR